MSQEKSGRVSPALALARYLTDGSVDRDFPLEDAPRPLRLSMNNPLRRVEACAQDGERVVEEIPGVVAHRLVRECGCVIIRVTRPTFVSGLSDGGDPVWTVVLEQEFPCESCVFDSVQAPRE